MNISLYIGTELADFNEAFNVVFSIGDIRELGFGNSNKTYTLNIPLTKTNKRLLKYINQPDVKSEITSIARLYLDGNLIIQGSVKILSSNKTSARAIITADDWIEDLKNKKMTDLDLSSYDHLLTAVNVEASWTASYPFVRYPMINFGYTQSGTAEWWAPDFIPAFQVTSLISKILSPYTINSSFLASAAAKNLYILARERLGDDGFIENKKLEVKVDSPLDNYDTYDIANGETVTRTLIKDPLVLNNLEIDEGGDWGGAVYTAPESGTYRFTCRFKLSCTNSTGEIETNSQDVILRIYRNATVVAEYTASGTSNIIHNMDRTIDTKYIHCDSGDVIKAYLSLSHNMTNPFGVSTVAMWATIDTTFENVWDEICRYPGLGKNVSAEELMPDMSQLDFLAAIRDIFNLRFWFDKQKQVVYIEPWDAFISNTVIDLSEYIDYDSINSETITGSYSKKITYKWADDSGDGAYSNYLQSYDSPGLKTIALASDYTKEGEMTKQSQFSTIIESFMLGIGGSCATIRNANYKDEITFRRAAGFNTRLVKWIGMTATGLPWNYNGVTKTSFPKITGLSFVDIYGSYLQKTYHYIDKGKLITAVMKLKPGMLSQFMTVVNSATSEGFRPTYKLSIDGIDCYFILQEITSDGIKAELQLILK